MNHPEAIQQALVTAALTGEPPRRPRDVPRRRWQRALRQLAIYRRGPPAGWPGCCWGGDTLEDWRRQRRRYAETRGRLGPEVETAVRLERERPQRLRREMERRLQERRWWKERMKRWSA